MKLSEIRQVLETRGLRLTRSLGQNFLHDGNQLTRIAQAAELREGDSVLEIGPGLGVLTEHLLAGAGQVCAVEKDARLVEFLQERFSGTPGLELIHADALAWLKTESRDWSGWKLVANLPYSVASPLLVELGLRTQGPRLMVVTVQQEVAHRLMARAGGHPYGILSLLVQVHYEPESWFRIPPTCFFPAPKVDSACVTLVRRPEPVVEHGLLPAFVRLVKLSFSQRRKMMFKLLKTVWPEDRLTEAFAALDLPVKARAEQITLGQFARLTRYLE